MREQICRTIFVCGMLWTVIQAHNPLPQEFHHIVKHVRSTIPSEEQEAAAYGVIERTIGEDRASDFNVHIDFTLPPNHFRLFKDNTSNSITITASTGVAACKAFYHYLKYFCNCHISWEGDQLQTLPLVLPEVDHEESSDSHFVYYQNVCTWSYSFVWWNWTDWRRHIDWMTMNGINLSLAPVQELVWTIVYRELGLTQDEIDDHFAGPAFMAWQRMGNMRGWGGPLTQAFKLSSSALQSQVVQAMRELGIAVALPTFAGHVPVAFARLYPDRNLTRAAKWNSFPDEYASPIFIDPLDPLFHTIGTKFLQTIVDIYGSDNHIYFSDPFNEMQPSRADTKYVASAADSIYRAMMGVDPNAVWLMQGWMFVENPFWTDTLMRSFITAVPRGRMLVLDLQAECSPQYSRTESFYGQPFLWCMLHNFGGTLGMHGSMEVVNRQIQASRKSVNSTMLGFGITPEGINQNYMMYEFALERGWDQTPVDTHKWMDHYVRSRYGGADNVAKRAWNHLRTSVYSFSGTSAIRGKYVICRRPGTKYPIVNWYNYTQVIEAWKDLLTTATAQPTSNLILHDLVDVTRQYLQNRIDQLYSELISALKSKDLGSFRPIAQQFIEAIQDTERILATHSSFLLGTWLRSARAMGSTQAERQLFEINARNQITLWGPTGQIVDYAMKQWSGVVGDYCLPRWQLFIDVCVKSMVDGKPINMERFREKLFKEVENPFQLHAKSYPTEGKGNAVVVSNELYGKWINGSI